MMFNDNEKGGKVQVKYNEEETGMEKTMLAQKVSFPPGSDRAKVFIGGSPTAVKLTNLIAIKPRDSGSDGGGNPLLPDSKGEGSIGFGGGL